MPASLPSGVLLVARVFLLAAVYLGAISVIMLASPGAVSMALGAPLLNGLELAGPYMFLITAAAAALIGWGLLRLNPWARRAAIAVALVGVVMLVPAVSAAAVDFRASLLWQGLAVVVRVVMVWYLYQEPVGRAFSRE